MKQNAERSILTAAKLIAPVIDDTFSSGQYLVKFTTIYH